MSRRGVAALAVLAAAVLLVVTRCVPQDVSPDDYRDQAAKALGDAVSEVGTTRLVLEQVQQADAFGSYAVITIRRSEQTLSAAEQSFTELTTPEGLDQLDSQTSDLLSRASDLVTEVRLCVERTHGDACPDLDATLSDLGDRLESAEQQVP